MVVLDVTARVLESVVAFVTPKVPPIVVLLLTASVEDSVAAPEDPNVPATCVSPVPASTVNLLLLTARSLVTSNVPVTERLPPKDPSSVTTRSSPT